MPEPLLVKCRKCGLVFDKHLNRTCPKCEPRTRPGAAPPPEAKTPLGAGAAGAATDAAASARPARQLPMPERRVVGALVLGAILGAAASLVVWNQRAHTGALVALPTPSVTDAGASGGERAAAGPPPPPIASTVIAAPGETAPAQPIELVDAHAGAPREDGSREYTVVLANRTPNTVKDLHVHGIGEDKKGQRLVTDDVAVNPPLLGTSRQATATIAVKAGGVLHEFVVSGWVQHGATLRLDAHGDEPVATSAESASRPAGEEAAPKAQGYAPRAVAPRDPPSDAASDTPSAVPSEAASEAARAAGEAAQPGEATE